MVKIIDAIFYNGGGTDTAAALRLTNSRILQENLGMRPVKDGVPKVVVLVTDGQSNVPAQTIAEAKALKDRGFNIISVGVGNINEKELIEVASSVDDFYKVDDFNKIVEILKGLSRSAVLQPAQVVQQLEIKSKLEKNTYKYFKYPLDNVIEEEFTIEIEILTGNTELFYSFEDQNPKDVEDSVKLNSTSPDTEIDGNFFEKIINRQKRQLIELRNDPFKKYYTIKKPTDLTAKTLYFSIKGYEAQNEFQMFIYNKTVEPPSTEPPSTESPPTTAIPSTTSIYVTELTTINSANHISLFSFFKIFIICIIFFIFIFN